MDVLAMIDHARAAGLTVLADSGNLIVRGPATAAPLARALGRHKAAVLSALTTDNAGNGNTTPTKAADSGGSVTVTSADGPHAILAQLQSHGLDLIVEPAGRIYLAGPSEAVAALPADLVEAMDLQWPALRQLATPEPSPALEEIDCPPPCPKCGSLELWQTVTGNWRCQSCDPPNMRRADRLSRDAAKLRRQSPPPADGEPPAITTRTPR